MWLAYNVADLQVKFLAATTKSRARVNVAHQRSNHRHGQKPTFVDYWLALRPTVDDQAMFLNRFGTRLTVTGIQLRLAEYCQRAGVWITCHQLRHTFGRHLTEAHVPVTSIQRLLGHVRLRTTEVYLHISDQQVQADYEAAMAALAASLTLKAGDA
jgi:site-specific recombinase XerC